RAPRPPPAQPRRRGPRRCRPRRSGTRAETAALSVYRVLRPNGLACLTLYTAAMPGSTRIIPLGGLGEVGKNMTVIEADGEALVIDAGLAFPRDEHLGGDLIIPEFSSLVD